MTKPKRKSRPRRTSASPRCGLCGRSDKLAKTLCCGQWICDDADQYVPFSYARNSCWRNHDRYTLCGYHYHETHDGHWKDCSQCREGFETEMYVWYGTNEYNFERLENPPEFEPTLCSKCGTHIVLSDDAFTWSGDEYWCEECTAKEMEERFSSNLGSDSHAE